MRRAAIGALVLAGGLAPALAEARTPLPTIVVVQPERPRVRLLDVRWSTQVGYGNALARRTHAIALGTEGHISFVELSAAAQLHVAFGMSGLLDPSRGSLRPAGVLGADFGLGLSRHLPGRPALVATVTAGPRWQRTRATSRDRSDTDLQPGRAAAALRVDGWGVVGKLELYPFYRTIPEILADDDGWLRESLLSGLHVWALARYDVLRSGRAPTIGVGVGFDLARLLFVPLPAKRG